MKRPLHFVCAHGIGKNTSSQFAADAMGWLLPRLSEYGVQATWAPAHWGPVLDAPEARMLADSKRWGSEGRLMQRVVLGTLADALQFPHHAKAIFEVFDGAVDQAPNDARVVFVGHSLGCILSLRYLEARPDLHNADVHAVFTGCNVPLFVEQGFVPPAGLDRPGRLVCAYDEDDAIGWPCKMWASNATDIQVSVGGWLGWSGASHTGYWTSKKLWSKLLPGIVRTFAL